MLHEQAIHFRTPYIIVNNICKKTLPHLRQKKEWVFPTGILVILSALSKSGREMTLYMLTKRKPMVGFFALVSDDELKCKKGVHSTEGPTGE